MILPFIPRESDDFLTDALAEHSNCRCIDERTPSGELPLNAPQYLDSIDGADEKEIQQKAIALNPWRLMLRLVCETCGYNWQAPTAGACPQCQSSCTKQLAAVVCMAKRV